MSVPLAEINVLSEMVFITTDARGSQVKTLTYANCKRTDGLLICTLISENQGLEKSRSDSNLNLYHTTEKNPGDKLKKNPDVQEFF